MTTREHEQTLNVQLADELRSLSLNAKPEAAQPGRRRIDVEVRIGPVLVAVEAEHGQSRAKQAEAIRDADARLQQGLAQCAVAVCYPDDTTRQTLSSANLQWTVRDTADNPLPASDTDWTTGDLEHLAAVIRLTPAQLGNPDYTAAALSSSLDGAVHRLNESQKQELARALDLPQQTRNRRPVRNPWDAPAKRALLVVATAVMFHSRLDSHRLELRPEYDNRTNPPEPFTGDWPPDMAQRCADAPDPVSAFSEAWDLILALDYKPIFETGRAALLSCPRDSAFTGAIRDAARSALAVVGDVAGLRHDLLGRIFHTVLDTARYDGSFYTTTPAATLLATLAIGENFCDWQDPEAIARLRITDPACGTGTLLMAAAERIRELAPQWRDNETVARALIEQVFSGYDVNLTATHMAATTLGLLSPSTRFENMKIGRATLGEDNNGEVKLGSLEMLGPDGQLPLLAWPTGISQFDTAVEMSQPEPSDLVIMNPPFTRDSLRHDQFSPDVERKIKAREKAIFANTPVHLSGNATPFLVLADYINKADCGTLASVLPLVAATNASTLSIRQHLAARYHIETIVTSHDPERIYFSENTSIGEMLLVCRRWPVDKGPKPATRVINLAANPDTPADAINVAWAINDGTITMRRDYCTVQEWPESKMAAGDWGAVQFLSPYLCEQFAKLRDSALFPATPLGRIAAVGPAGQRIRDAYARSAMPDAQGRSALWNHDTDVTQTMSARADTHIVAKPGLAHLAETYWQQRSRLLLPQRVRLNTVRALSVRLDMPAVGSAWVPCNPESETLEKAICVYLNSSVGILALLGNRSNTTPAYPRFSIDDMRQLVVPNFAAIDEDAAAHFARAYDALANRVLLPLPNMDVCDARRSLDATVAGALNLDRETVDTIRRSLAMEPSVTGQRYGEIAGAIIATDGDVPVRIIPHEPPEKSSLVLSPKELAWLEKFREKLQERFPGQVEDIVVYGPRSRGDTHPDSDFNTLIVISEGDWRKEDEVGYLGHLLDMDGFFVAPTILVCTKMEWNRHKELGSTLYEIVAREGVSVL